MLRIYDLLNLNNPHLNSLSLTLFVLLALFWSGHSANAASSVVLFDQGHGQPFVVERQGKLDLSGLSTLFIQNNYQVKSTTNKLTDEIPVIKRIPTHQFSLMRIFRGENREVLPFWIIISFDIPRYFPLLLN